MWNVLERSAGQVGCDSASSVGVVALAVVMWSSGLDDEGRDMKVVNVGRLISPIVYL